MKRFWLFVLTAVFFLASSSVSMARKSETKDVAISKKSKKEASAPSGKSKVAKILWSEGLKSASKKAYFPEVASPLSMAGRIYVGTHSGLFYSVDAKNGGDVAWTFKSSGPIATGAVGDEKSVYFGNNKGNVYALDAATGEKRWEFWVGAEVLGRPALQGNSLYVVTTSREVYAINASSGNQLWVTTVRGYDNKLTMRGNASVSAAGDSLYIGFADGQVVNLSAHNGGLVWTHTLTENRHTQFKDVDTTVLVDGGSLFVAGYADALVRMDRGSGQITWSKEVASGTDLAVDENQLYVSTNDGQVAAFDKKNGIMKWETSLRSGTLSAPSVVGSYLLVGTEEKGSKILETSSGRILQSLSVNFQGPADVEGQTVYFLSSEGRLYAIGLGSYSQPQN